MKAILSAKPKSFLFLFAIFSSLFFQPIFSFAQGEASPALSNDNRQLGEIQKRLDESQQREEQILANQKKILEEINRLRTWHHN